MQKFHILNGDCLANQLEKTDLKGEIIVCRECLIDGNVKANKLEDFWVIRADFIATLPGILPEMYFEKSVKEFQKISRIPEGSEVCLWFEDDLFCQTNMWFIISLLSKKSLNNKLFRVFPIIKNEADKWKGYGVSTPQTLIEAYESKVAFGYEDIELGKNLWKAYQNADFGKLSSLSATVSPCFQDLRIVCQAHIDRFPTDDSLGKPEKVVKKIIESGILDFEDVFAEFCKREGIYGFGDLQLQKVYNKMI